jgi:5-methylcytosine-specific restriction endonuclease McrA
MGINTAALYNTRQWRNARAIFLKQNPLCVYCRRLNIRSDANVVDHITPHRGSLKLFWDTNNWQSLCFTCHNSHKQREENGKAPLPATGLDGWPLD